MKRATAEDFRQSTNDNLLQETLMKPLLIDEAKKRLEEIQELSEQETAMIGGGTGNPHASYYNEGKTIYQCIDPGWTHCILYQGDGP